MVNSNSAHYSLGTYKFIGIHAILLSILIFLAPFEFNMINSIVSGSILKYYILFMNVILFFPITKNNQQYRIPGISVSLLFWVIYIIIRSFGGSQYVFLRAYNHIQAIGLMAITFFTVSMLHFNRKELDLLLYCSILSGVILAALLLRNPVVVGSYTERFTASLFQRENDPNNIAAFLTVPLAISFHFILSKGRKTGIFVASAGLIVLGVLLTGSRGGTLAAVGVIVVTIFTNRQRSKVSYLFVSISTLIFLVILLGQFIPKETIERVISVFDILNRDGIETEARWRFWQRGLEMFTTNPIFGIGFGQFAARNSIGIHNTFLWLLVDLGIVGLIPLVLVIWHLFVKARRVKASLTYAVLAGMSINIMFLDSLNKKFFWLNLILAIVIINTYRDAETERIREGVRSG